MAKTLKGVGVSEGFVIGKATFINNEDVVVKQLKDQDVSLETTKFKNAVFKTTEQFETLQNRATNNNNSKEYEILDVYIQMAKDPIFTMNVVKYINQNKCNAEYAVQQVSKDIFNQFQKMDDQYFRDRGVDINDVSYRVIKNILGYKNIDLTSIKEPGIVLVNNLTPTMMTQIDPKYVKGIITNVGGFTSHVAIMAKSLNIPTILELPEAFKEIKDQEVIACDGSTGEVFFNLNKDEENEFSKREEAWLSIQSKLNTFENKQAKTTDGKVFNVEGNINSVNEIDVANVNAIDGIGLFRTEYIYLNSSSLPSEDEQVKIYESLSDKLNNKKVVIRTMDIGGDKNVDYLQLPKSTNPFLGLRGLRYSLNHLDIFKTQLRAILRASAKNKNILVMFPMVATVEEFKQAKAIVEECEAELKSKGIKYDDNIQIGMMVEIPAAAMNIEAFIKYADFFSVGTNDLMQYSMAANRLDEDVAYLYQPTNPGVLRIIKNIADKVSPTNKRLIVCGEMANDYMALPLLVGMGIQGFSVPIPRANAVKAIISQMSYEEGKTLVNQAIKCDTAQQVNDLLNKFYERTKQSKQ